MQVTTLGIDLAKNVFQVHGVDAQGRQVFSKALRRSQLRNFVAQLPACRIGMEACGSAHYWARELQALGHEVRLMAPQFVKPYVKTNKNDRADAEAICEAVTRPNMRFVPIKTRTAQANQVRGLLAEFGIVVPQGMTALFRELPGNGPISATALVAATPGSKGCASGAVPTWRPWPWPTRMPARSGP